MSFTITIGGNNRTGTVRAGSFSKIDNLNQQVDTCRFIVRKKGSDTFAPQVGESVVVTRNSTVIFGGVVLRVSERLATPFVLDYTVDCVDYSQYLKRRLVTERYTNTTVGAIISDIITTYTSDGFTVVNAASDFPITSISFNRLTVAECLQKLADAISYVWYVDYSKDIHFFPKNAERAPFDVTDTGKKHLYQSLEITEDLSRIKNSILVQGGDTESTTTRTEEFDGDGVRDIFRLANKFASEPVITVVGVPQTVGIEYLDDDTLFDCMWNYNEKYVRFTAGNIPAAGTRNIDVTGTYLFPIVVVVPAPASQVQFGTYELAVTDKSIKSQDEATTRAIAELQAYKSQLYDGSFRTYEDGLRSGQTITINSTQRGRSIDVLIQSVSASLRDPNGDQLEYTVRFATMNTVGILEYLRKQLRKEEVIVDDDVQLLAVLFREDAGVGTDDVDAPTYTTAPYLLANSSGVVPSGYSGFVINYCKLEPSL